MFCPVRSVLFCSLRFDLFCTGPHVRVFPNFFFANWLEAPQKIHLARAIIVGQSWPTFVAVAKFVIDLKPVDHLQCIEIWHNFSGKISKISSFSIMTPLNG